MSVERQFIQDHKASCFIDTQGVRHCAANTAFSLNEIAAINQREKYILNCIAEAKEEIVASGGLRDE